jgi:hypothetical protein
VRICTNWRLTHPALAIPTRALTELLSPRSMLRGRWAGGFLPVAMGTFVRNSAHSLVPCGWLDKNADPALSAGEQVVARFVEARIAQ